ncbi:DNA cytosine methyltransferase [Polymorphospora lycopeni]|uniref:DNA (cytosine-5-)-methyltransferase n=1 Tax=Polymorphospora lycopeni TaxID=3140240 RepID=A0ABV5CXS2_9ACTN
MNVLSLFAGIGGLELGLERAGMTVVGQVEIDPFCRHVLAAHWPEVPRHDDVRTAVAWWRSRPRPAVHVVAGGFPCQPVSDAGRKLAQADPRWLWNPMADVIADLRPEWVVAENVPGLRTRGLNLVLADLHRLGYTARAGYISACEMGAPHPRKRLFILAHPQGQGRCPWRAQRTGPATPDGEDGLRDVRPGGRGRWATEPDVARMAHGVPAGVDRRRALGNAVVPDVAEHIGRLITNRTASATARRAA